MTTTHLPLLFLSGAGLPGWIWDEVRATLPEEHPSHVAEYRHRASASLDDYAAEVLAEAPWPRFVVVAHSIGGTVGAQMASQAPDRLAGFLGISAAIPRAGQSFLGALPFPQRHMIGAVMRVAGTRPPAKMIRSGLAHGVEPEVAERLVQEFAPESQALYRDPTAPRAFPALRGYVQTTDDRELPIGLQQRSASTLGAPALRTIGTGHLPMLEAPGPLSALLMELLASGER